MQIEIIPNGERKEIYKLTLEDKYVIWFDYVEVSIIFKDLHLKVGDDTVCFINSKDSLGFIELFNALLFNALVSGEIKELNCESLSTHKVEKVVDVDGVLMKNDIELNEVKNYMSDYIYHM